MGIRVALPADLARSGGSIAASSPGIHPRLTAEIATSADRRGLVLLEGAAPEDASLTQRVREAYRGFGPRCFGKYLGVEDARQDLDPLDEPWRRTAVVRVGV